HLKRILDDFTVQAGVEVRFFTRVTEADMTGRRVNGVVLSNVEGLRYVPAKAFIDATGDAALAALAGAECTAVLRDTQTVSPSTLCSLLAGMDWNDPAYGPEGRGLDAVKARVRSELVPKAIDD